MSTGAQVAVLDARGVRRARPRAELQPRERPLVRIAAFAGLALYGTLRWAQMLQPAPFGRLLALVAVALAVAVAGPWLRARAAVFAIALGVISALALFALAGIPLSWLRHLRIAVTADAVGQGLSALPRVLVPYSGINDWVRMVVILGAGVLLLDAAAMVAFAPRPLSDLRRAGAALPLLVLAVVPSTVVRPQLPYLHGLILFVLLAAFVWGERIPRRSAAVTVGMTILAATAAMVAAPRLDPHHPWLNYEALAGTLSPGHVEAFDWSQRYGPLTWPRAGREVMDVRARRADYWKAENLDLFTGLGWALGSNDSFQAQFEPPAHGLARWTQTIQVTIRGMRTSQIIAAGSAERPQHIAQDVQPGVGSGTWTTSSDLQPGDSYTVRTYSPQPSAQELAQAGTAYPRGQLQSELTLELPQPHGSDVQITFPTFGSRRPPVDVTNLSLADAAVEVNASPYGRVYALARRLASRAATPAAFVESVLRYLGHDYTYSEVPPQSEEPLVSFLLSTKTGYCQQFAGAMALLLRMGGVPARVATGFATGTYDSATHEYVVSDLDAHAWVEAWFPRYGWVRFDPTPAAAPARGGHVALPTLANQTTPAAPRSRLRRRAEPVPASAPAVAAHRGGTPVATIVLAAVLGLALVAVIAGLLLTRRSRPGGRSDEELLDELERALARCGRPLTRGMTLAALEHRFRDSPGAVQYIRTLRLARFAGAAERPTRAHRRALRTELGAGLGALGRLRALWALPPSPLTSLGRRMGLARGLHSD